MIENYEIGAKTRALDGRLANADDRAARHFTRGMQARVVETGEDIGVDPEDFPLADFRKHARHGGRLVGTAFDADGCVARIDRGDLRLDLLDAKGAIQRLRRHGRRGVRIDETYVHCGGTFHRSLSCGVRKSPMGGALRTN